jgi:hypothetical protein
MLSSVAVLLLLSRSDCERGLKARERKRRERERGLKTRERERGLKTRERERKRREREREKEERERERGLKTSAISEMDPDPFLANGRTSC